MNTPSAPRARTARAPFVFTLTALVVAIIGTLLYRSTPFLESSPGPSAPAASRTTLGQGPEGAPRDVEITEADGMLPDGATVFDDQYPGIANLDQALLRATREAATAAAADGITITVNSGWRSKKYQEHLLATAISKYGSVEKARRWVASAETSAHVSGDAVDVGPAKAAAWLAENGSRYGLCQIYSNESWHFELRAKAAHEGCPAKFRDPTEDPRMQG